MVGSFLGARGVVVLVRSSIVPVSALSVASFFAAACSSAPAPDAGVASVPPLSAAPVASAAPPAPAPRKLTREQQILAATCKDRSPCSLAQLRDVSQGGSERWVALLRLNLESYGPEGEGDEEEPSEDGTAPEEPADFSTTGDSDSFSVRYGGCRHFEYWVMSGPSFDDARLLAEVCNDGMGASGVGEVSATIAGGFFELDKSGGSAWRWSEAAKVRLTPLEVLSEAHDGFWTLGENVQHSTWDWEKLAGKVEWEAPRCDAGGTPGSKAEFEAVVLPNIEVDAAFKSGGWKEASIAKCAAAIDGGGSGFTLSGKADPRSARFSAVVSGDRVYVEVFDDRYSAADSVEVWFAGDAPGYFNHCLDDAKPAFGVSVSPKSGRAQALGKGGPAPSVEVGATPADGGAYRASIALPAKTEGVTVVYRDADGQRVTSAIASSRFDAKDHASLGQVRLIEPSRGTCKLVDRTELRPVLVWGYPQGI